MNGLKRERDCRGPSHSPYVIFSVWKTNIHIHTNRTGYSAATAETLVWPSSTVHCYSFDVGLTRLTVCEFDFLGITTPKTHLIAFIFDVASKIWNPGYLILTQQRATSVVCSDRYWILTRVSPQQQEQQTCHVTCYVYMMEMLPLHLSTDTDRTCNRCVFGLPRIVIFYSEN